MISDNKVKFGILGLGRVIEKRVAKVFSKELKHSRVSAVFDRNKKKNKKFSKLFNCKLNRTIENFLNSDTDFVYIATESGNHYKNILKCFSYNKNVIVEKPPVLRVKQLTKLHNISRKKKLLFYVVYQNRFNK